MFYVNSDQPPPPVIVAFEAWLIAKGYEPAGDYCPWDNEESTFMFAAHASDLVGDFLLEQPQLSENAERVRDHAFEIGQVADMKYFKSEPEAWLDDIPDETDHEEPE